MRRLLADELYTHMKVNKKIFLLVGDLGYKVWDKHFQDFPDRCINTGASEQALLDIAVGLSYEGFIPVCYSITPFLVYRPFETLRTYIDHERLHIVLVGSGRDDDYRHDGYSHDASDVGRILDSLDNITQYFPDDKKEIPHILLECLTIAQPYFISLQR